MNRLRCRDVNGWTCCPILHLLSVCLGIFHYSGAGFRFLQSFGQSWLCRHTRFRYGIQLEALVGIEPVCSYSGGYGERYACLGIGGLHLSDDGVANLLEFFGDDVEDEFVVDLHYHP